MPRGRIKECLVCFCLGLLALDTAKGASPVADAERLRFIVETDAGGDPDDEQSLVRFLLYTCEWDVEAIIANRATTRRPENRSPEDSGLGIVRAQLKAYAACYEHLVQHDPRYPTPAQLEERTMAGDDSTEAAVDRIVAVVDRNDPRPVWYADWGSDRGSGKVNLRRALDRVWRERGANGYAKFKQRLRLIGYDQFAEHTGRAPGWRIWVDTFEPPKDGRRWYHRFSALTAKAGGFDLNRDVLTGHGPLGALYPTNTTHWQKEGDTGTFLYLVPTGLSDPYEPAWGGWAGRYGTNENFAGHPYFWANQVDDWNGTTNRDNTLARWAAALQNDFRARLDWCVRERAGANHPPVVVVNGVPGTSVLQFHARCGSEVRLDAAGTRDPDGNRLDYSWFTYPEAGSYRGPVTLRLSNDADSSQAVLRVPEDAGDKSIHVVLAVTDRGNPPLTRYRRAVITGSDAKDSARRLAPFYSPPPEYAEQLGSFRSPLQFADGQPVRDRAAWEKRRQELLTAWHGVMGPWPELLRAPQVEVLAESRRDNFKQRRVRVPIAPGQSGDGWLLLPDGAGPFPAVLVVYYEPETSVGLNPEQPLRDFGLQLARRGLVTLSIGTPGGNAWKPEVGGAVCQPLSYHAYVAANCWRVLTALPEVDSKRIGVVGHSYGGKWAMIAAALWEQFAVVAVSDPGIVFDETRANVNYWEPWYLGLDPKESRPKAGIPSAENPRTGAYKTLMARGWDLHELHALIAPRPFLVSGGAEDPPSRWTALNHTVAVNRLLGFTNRVAFTSRAEHTPDETSNAQLYAFFEHFLRDNPLTQH
jgi:hypothetical protein